MDTIPLAGVALDQAPAGSVVRVLPDVSGLHKTFDYAVPEGLGGPPVRIGSIVRVSLHGRRTAGWVVAVGTDPPEGIELEPILKVSSFGPLPDVVELCRWASEEWSGRWSAVLKSASPEPFVRAIPSGRPVHVAVGPDGGVHSLFDGHGPRIVRSAPAADRFEILRAAAARGPCIVVCPEQRMAGHHAGRLRRAGIPAHRHPEDWAAAFTGGVVLGARSAVFASVPDLTSIVVLDEHDDALANERNPTWHARDVAIERSRRARVPCLLVSAAPSPAATHQVPDIRRPDRSVERAGWPIVQVIDRRDEDPGRAGLFSDPLVRRLRSTGRALCVLNRKGRAVMLACASCGELVRTVDGHELMVEIDGELIAPRSGERRPKVCAICSGTSLKRLRLGVSRAAEELGVLLREPVGEVTASSSGGDGLDHRVIVGTEALLHRVASAETVAFLDFDNELLAHRYRAAEQAMSLLVRAAAVAGARSGGGRVLVQTRTPDHRVLFAAVRSDPDPFTRAELALRQAGQLPPFAGLAAVSGTGAGEFLEPLQGRLDVEVVGPDPTGRYVVKGADRRSVATALAELDRPRKARISVAVDPPRA